MADDISTLTYICNGSTYGGPGDGFTVLDGAELLVGSADGDHPGPGVITSAVVEEGALATVCAQGLASESVVAGSMTVNQGGAAAGAVLSGGDILVRRGGVLSGAVLSAAGAGQVLRVYGTACNVEMASAGAGSERGYVNVYSGGLVSGVRIVSANNYLQVSSGGVPAAYR